MIQTIIALAAALAFLSGSAASAPSHTHGGVVAPADAILPGPV